MENVLLGVKAHCGLFLNIATDFHLEHIYLYVCLNKISLEI